MKPDYRREALSQLNYIQKTLESLQNLPWMEESVYLNEYFANQKIKSIREALDSLESCIEGISDV